MCEQHIFEYSFKCILSSFINQWNDLKSAPSKRATDRANSSRVIKHEQEQELEQEKNTWANNRNKFDDGKKRTRKRQWNKKKTRAFRFKLCHIMQISRIIVIKLTATERSSCKTLCALQATEKSTLPRVMMGSKKRKSQKKTRLKYGANEHQQTMAKAH